MLSITSAAFLLLIELLLAIKHLSAGIEPAS